MARVAGWPGWVLHRMFASYWLLAVCAVFAAFPFTVALLHLDGEGATAWLIAQGLSPVSTADTAKDFVGVAAGINAAFITLYFSITLIVLSMAAGNLGVRLIDRWLERRLIRWSLGGLSFSLVVTLIAMLAIDAEASLPETPLATVLVVLLLQAINIAMLAVSLHGLGRTMFIDSSIDRLSRDAQARSLQLVGVVPPASQPYFTIDAPREGYIEDVDTDSLARLFDGQDFVIVVHAAPGQHVVKGDPLLSATADLPRDRVQRLLPIGPYRSDNQGVVFRIRLLVEIAARALSPAINDFYTAITCADKLAAIIESQTGTWIDEQHAPALAQARWLIVEGQDFRSLFEDPLNAFRQAACQYPSVAIRMIDNYARIARRQRINGAPDGLIELIGRLASELAGHARSVAQFEGDAEDIAQALATGFATSAKNLRQVR